MSPTTPPPWSVSAPSIKLGQRGSQKPLPNQTQRIKLVGDGPCVSSASHALESQPFCWDCNGFYRKLGLPPGSPRIEVARSFMALDGHRSSRLTTAARVLIDKHTKKLYDAMPLGSFWPDDEALVEGLICGDFEVVQGDGAIWSVYVDGVPESSINHPVIDTWRWMICFLIWRANSPVDRFAMGVAPVAYAAIVGFRNVVFVPVDTKPTWEYVTQIAIALQRLG